MHRTLTTGLLLGFLVPALLPRQATPTTSRFSPPVAQRPDVRAALAYVEQHFDEQVAEWIRLTEIPALSTHEQQRAAYIRAELERAGLLATTDDIGNVMARRPGTGSGPTIVIAAHMDTVHPMDTDVKVRRLPDGTLHAPGVFDDTASDVNVLQTIRALNAAQVRTKGDVIFLFTVQEELGLKGMYYWFDHHPNEAAMIVAVDAELGAVNYGALGIYWSKMLFTAAGAHTNNSRGQPHPARAAAQSLTREFIQKSEAGGRPETLTSRLVHPLVETAIAVLKYLDIQPSVAPTGSTDANVGVVHGVPSVAIGRSRGGNQHSLSEWADIASAKTGTQQLILLLAAM